MVDILAMQSQEPQETPGQEKASKLSLYKLCYNSRISVAFCFVK